MAVTYLWNVLYISKMRKLWKKIICWQKGKNLLKFKMNNCWIFRAWGFPCARQLIIRRSDSSANRRWTLFVDFELGELGLLYFAQMTAHTRAYWNFV